ncbi:MAG: aldehyde ferredoxin oxidoreductase family protein [Candidatus Thorarchaeota archaeon]
MMYGYRGKILRVNLSTGATSNLKLDLEMAREYIGGMGLGCRLLFDLIDASTDPLGPENPLLFLTGPFCGTMVPTGSKATVCAKSPQTGWWGYSTFGGHLGADIKFAGYDGILFAGKAEKPVYLQVKDDNVEIRDASHLRGKDTEQTWEMLKKETGFKKAGVARIGLAGENLVKYAAILIDHFRAAGRTGMGAVMGSKNLKALVVHGSDRNVPVAEPEKIRKRSAELTADKTEDATFRMYSELGTAGYVDMASMMYGSLPAGYYGVSDFDSYNLSGTTVKETILVGKTACFRCPIGCGRVIQIDKGKYATGRFAGPELEVTGTMGTLILNNDAEALSFANKQLDLFGIDTISGGNTIALAYYLISEGKITKKDLDGINPKWGEVDSAVKLIEKIAHREGIGDLMAEGSLAFAEKFGVGELAVQVNGLETPMHDPRGFSGMAIAYATSPRGACHMSCDMYNVQMGVTDEGLGVESVDRFDNEAVLAAKVQDFRCVTNSALTCHFYPIKADELTEMMRLVTGWDFTLEELVKAGERIFTLQRLMNLKLGYDNKNEGLPELLLKPLDGPSERHVPDVEAQLDTWYKYRKWSRKTGKPSKSKIAALGLSDLS